MLNSSGRMVLVGFLAWRQSYGGEMFGAFDRGKGSDEYGERVEPSSGLWIGMPFWDSPPSCAELSWRRERG